MRRFIFSIIFSIVKEEKDDAEVKRKIREGIEKLSAGVTEDRCKAQIAMTATIEKQLGLMTSPWYRAFSVYDPRPALEKVKVPVLAMNGALDLQAAALKAGHNPDYQIVKLPHLNDLFQTAQTSAPMEYAKIEETFAPAALQVMGDWIGRHVQ